MKNTTISQVFNNLTDPRMDRRKRHSLVNILTISICAVICGCDDFSAIEEYGKLCVELKAGQHKLVKWGNQLQFDELDDVDARRRR